MYWTPAAPQAANRFSASGLSGVWKLVGVVTSGMSSPASLNRCMASGRAVAAFAGVTG